MISVPYTAMYTAKQLIAEVTALQMLQTIGLFVCAYILMGWNGDRLEAYAVYMTMIPVLIMLALVVRACCAFPECSVRFAYFVQPDKLKKLFAFAGGDFFGWLGGTVRDQGMAILINHNFGLGTNASYTISNQVSSHAMSLSNAMMGALIPAMTTAEGAGNHEESVSLAFRGIKFGVLSIVLFAIPLIIEMDEILRLWLVVPPPESALFCRCMLVAFICHKLGFGHHLAILAGGRVVMYQIVVGSVAAGGIAIASIGLFLKLGLVGVACSFVVTFVLMTLVRVAFARKLCNMSVRHWLLRVVAPILLTGFISLACGGAVQVMMDVSIVRLFLVVLVSTVMTVLQGYVVVLDAGERSFLKGVVRRLKCRLYG